MAAPSTKREGIVERRRTRFAVTLVVLERLLKWTRLEHAAFTERFLGVAPRIKPGPPIANAKKEQVLVDGNTETYLTSKDALRIPDQDVDVEDDADNAPCSKRRMLPHARVSTPHSRRRRAPR